MKAEEIHEAIARRAYTLYEQRGRHVGYHLTDWLQAEKELLHGLISTVLNEQSEKHNRWVQISHKLGTLYPLNKPEQMGCIVTIQKLARFELVILRMETQYMFRHLRDLPENPGDFDDILTYAYLWVLGAYEIARTLAQKTNHPGIARLKRQFERIRVPLAKIEASKKFKESDFNFPIPVITPDFNIGWAVNQSELILRDSLSHELFTALDQFCFQPGS